MNQAYEETAGSIDGKEVVMMLLDHIKLILLVTLAAAVLAFSVTMFMITPQYNASISMYVNNSTGIANSGITTSSDLTASQQLAETYITILQSDSIMRAVADQMNLEMSTTQMKKMVTADRLNNTEVIRVSVQCEDPVMAAKIANTIADVCPDMISNYVEASSVKIIDRAQVPKEQASPSVMKNTAIGVFLGLILSCAFVIVREILDVRVKTEEDLKKAFNLPILGIIPQIEIKEGEQV